MFKLVGGKKKNPSAAEDSQGLFEQQNRGFIEYVITQQGQIPSITEGGGSRNEKTFRSVVEDFEIDAWLKKKSVEREERKKKEASASKKKSFYWEVKRLAFNYYQIERNEFHLFKEELFVQLVRKIIHYRGRKDDDHFDTLYENLKRELGDNFFSLKEFLELA